MKYSLLPIAAVTLALLTDVGLALRIVPSRFDPAAAALWAVAALGPAGDTASASGVVVSSRPATPAPSKTAS